MLCLVAAQFGLSLDPSAAPAVLWRALTDRLTEYRYQQLETVILLDDADQAGGQVLVQVARLARHDTSPESRLTLVLAARPDRAGRLGDRLLDLAELRIDLEPWQQADTADFLQQSLKQAGCQASVFADPAISRLHELSRGIPRRVSQLADLALLASAGRELQQIDADVVESVYRELAVVEV
jgi:general secretion pathway protein A